LRIGAVEEPLQGAAAIALPHPCSEGLHRFFPGCGPQVRVVRWSRLGQFPVPCDEQCIRHNYLLVCALVRVGLSSCPALLYATDSKCANAQREKKGRRRPTSRTFTFL